MKEQIKAIAADCKKKGLIRASWKLQKLADKGTVWIDDIDDKEFWNNGIMEQVSDHCSIQQGKTGMRLNLMNKAKDELK
jgi:hypothetical protein